jgi:hypothetical protein
MVTNLFVFKLWDCKQHLLRLVNILTKKNHYISIYDSINCLRFSGERNQQ